MKRIISFVLVCALLLSGCASRERKTMEHIDSSTGIRTEETEAVKQNALEETELANSDISNTTSTTEEESTSVEQENAVVELASFQTATPEYDNLSDPDLLDYVEDSVYAGLVNNLDGGYFVENVSTVYISKEYLDEVSYNSQENIFFGYTLSELDEQFQGTRYVFTLSDTGETTVEPFEEYDDTYEQTIKNVAIGTGVILICVTVSVVSGGAGASAISVIFAESAKTGTKIALSSGGIGALASGIVTGVQTQNFDEAIKGAALAGGEGFKWGAISGAIIGGASKAASLKGATLNGLTMNQAAKIQHESKYPLDVIKQFKSIDEYQIYKNAGLKPEFVDGKISLIRNIDLSYESKLAGKTVTNLERVQLGFAPIEPATGKYYQLHHINQNADGTLAILTEAEHQGNTLILNKPGGAKEISEAAWAKQRKAYWKAFAKVVGG